MAIYVTLSSLIHDLSLPIRPFQGSLYIAIGPFSPCPPVGEFVGGLRRLCSRGGGIHVNDLVSSSNTIDVSKRNLKSGDCLETSKQYKHALCAQGMGLGANAMYVLTPRLNTFLSVQLGWGCSAALGVWTCYGITGQSTRCLWSHDLVMAE